MSLPSQIPEGYRPLDSKTLPRYLGDIASVREVLGGQPDNWSVAEVGDGNLNLVFVVEGPSGAVCVKQALPYLRLVGDSWPLPLSRNFIESEALIVQGRHAPGLVPKVHHVEPTLALLVMELLRPHIIMRKGMIAATTYPRFAEHISTFMARTLFFTSDLAMTAGAKKERIATFCINHELCKITEDLIFTNPYYLAENNRWTSPQLDDAAAAIRADGDLKIAVSDLKVRFMSDTQALIHGDLHTGSIMVTDSDTRVIDPEFAFFGPMGFDTGALLANLLINYFSQDGHATTVSPRESYQAWVLETADTVWNRFHDKFVGLWSEHHSGDAYPDVLFTDADLVARVRRRYMRKLFGDTLSFAGAKMIRRILGLAHNIDLEHIEDPDRRAVCERRCLHLARDLLVNTATFRSIEDVTAAARAVRESVG